MSRALDIPPTLSRWRTSIAHGRAQVLLQNVATRRGPSGGPSQRKWPWEAAWDVGLITRRGAAGVASRGLGPPGGMGLSGFRGIARRAITKKESTHEIH